MRAGRDQLSALHVECGRRRASGRIVPRRVRHTQPGADARLELRSQLQREPEFCSGGSRADEREAQAGQQIRVRSSFPPPPLRPLLCAAYAYASLALPRRTMTTSIASAKQP